MAAELPADPEEARSRAALALAALPGVRVRPDEPLAHHLPLRCGGPARIWALLDEPESWERVQAIGRQADLGVQVCWPLTDLLVREGGIDGLVVRPGAGFEGCELRAPEDGGPARLRLGAAEPWAALAAWSREPQDLSAWLGTWSGCPGGLLQGRDLQPLDGLPLRFQWLRGRQAEWTDTPAPPSPASLLRAVELPLEASVRGRRPRAAPARPGAILVDKSGLDLAAQLRLAGLPRTRLRRWLLAESEPGTLVNLGGGDLPTLQLLIRGLQDQARRSRGLDLDLRLPVIGRNPARRTPRRTP